MTDYILDSTVGAWQQQVKFTNAGYLFTHLSFPKYPCCIECDIDSRTNGVDDGRLFPSLYKTIISYDKSVP